MLIDTDASEDGCVDDTEEIPIDELKDRDEAVAATTDDADWNAGEDTKLTVMDEFVLAEVDTVICEDMEPILNDETLEELTEARLADETEPI